MPDYRFDNSDWQESSGDFTNITEVFTTEGAWPDVREALRRAGIPESQLNPFDFTRKFGLVRGRLIPPAGIDLGPLLRELPAGLNHLFGFSSPWREDDDLVGLVGTPKVWSTGAPEVAKVALPPRSPDGPGTGITVGVVDTGYRRHRWVRGACTYSGDDLEIEPKNDELDLIAGHGLFVAGLILEQAPGATVRMERVLSPDGHAEAIVVHDAICRLAIAGAQVINLSLGCYEYDDQAPFVLGHAIDWAREYQRSQGRQPEDIVFVAAAGNNGDTKNGSRTADPSRPFWPAALPDVWSVAAATPLPEPSDGRTWRIADFSSRSEKWVDVAAPGQKVLSCYTPYRGADEGEAEWAFWNGTSFSAAVVSGLLARAWWTLPQDRRRELSAPRREGDPQERSAELLAVLDGYQTPVATAPDDPEGRNGSWPVVGTASTARKGAPGQLTVSAWVGAGRPVL
jgi:hypothetical protein